MSAANPFNMTPQDAQQLMAQYNATQHAFGVGNMLSFTPPGFNQKLTIKFPDYRLPVCEKCKKNYKTRDMCRVRNAHTDLPWSCVYICITLDSSCTDANGKYVETPFHVRPNNWQPYCIKKEKASAYFDNKTPICAACKKKNYTRSFCRERHKHRSLPWSTVYVTLSAMEGLTGEEASDPAAAAAADETANLVDAAASAVKADDAETQAAVEAAAGIPVPTEDANGNPIVTTTSTMEPATDDINDIDASRTFLISISSKSCNIQWVELDESEMQNFGVPGTGGALGGYPTNMRGASAMAQYGGFYPSNPMALGGGQMPYPFFGMYPTPMQMAQFTGEGGEEAKDGGNPAEQYQQYMNWQAHMWYHQQAMMAAGQGAEGAELKEGEELHQQQLEAAEVDHEAHAEEAVVEGESPLKKVKKDEV
jgi:hypothetical protein